MNVYQHLQQAATANQSQFRIASLEFLDCMKEDLLEVDRDWGDLAQSGQYDYFNFNKPDLDFEVQSLIIVANKAKAYADLFFTYQNTEIPLQMPGPYMMKAHSSQPFMASVLSQHGYHLQPTFAVPHKLLATRTGLATYGRSNVTFVEGMGSYLVLDAYYSDVPPQVLSPLPLDTMASCKTCQACVKFCAGGAITADHRHIDPLNCITSYNESGNEPYPDHINICVQKCICGCMNCQMICRHNRSYKNDAAESRHFDAEETQMLLDGIAYEDLPPELQTKIDYLNLQGYMTPLPRNLQIMFDDYLKKNQ